MRDSYFLLNMLLDLEGCHSFSLELAVIMESLTNHNITVDWRNKRINNTVFDGSIMASD